jgi:hypothetical protein
LDSQKVVQALIIAILGNRVQAEKSKSASEIYSTMEEYFNGRIESGIDFELGSISMDIMPASITKDILKKRFLKNPRPYTGTQLWATYQKIKSFCLNSFNVVLKELLTKRGISDIPSGKQIPDILEAGDAE